MPKQLFQRPTALKLGNKGKTSGFPGQENWGRKKGKLSSTDTPKKPVKKPETEK